MSAAKSEAFYGAEFVRTEILDGLASGQRPGALMRLWLAGRSGEPRFDVIATEFGLDAAMVRLIASLGGDPLDTEVQSFMFDAINAIRTGEPTDNVASDWMIWTWDNGLVPLSTRFTGAEERRAAVEVIDLIRSNRSKPVEAAAFRRARNAVRQSTSNDEGLAAYGDILQAMAWNAKDMPGVIGDVVFAWTNAVRQDSLRASGWSSADESEFEALRSGIFDATVAEVQASGITDRDEMIRMVREREEARWQESGKLDMRERSQACRYEAGLRIADWTVAARKGLIGVLAGSISLD